MSALIKKFRRMAAGILLVGIAACAFLTGAVSYPSPTDAFFVNDFANVISASDENEIMSAGTGLYNATKAQIVVVTVQTLSGAQVDEYALNLGEQWGVGDEKTDTGIVLLLSVSERKVSVQVGYGLEGAVNDAKAGRILDTYAIPYFKNDDFSTGLRSAYMALVNEAYEEFGMTGPSGDEYQPTQEYEDTEFSPLQIVFGAIVLIGAVILFIRNPALFLLLFSRNNHRGGGGFGGGGGGFGGFSGGGGSFGGGGASRGF